MNPQLPHRELAVIGTLLAEWPAKLPVCCSKLIEHAPESFDDLRHATIAVAIRELWKSGKPVSTITVRDQLKDRLETAGGAVFLETLATQAATIGIAEFESEALWQAYQVRRTKTTLTEAVAALESAPALSGSIITSTVKTLETLSGSGDRESDALTIRQPDALLSLTFDDSDRILGDRLLATGQSLVIAGAGSIGKSRLLLQLAACVITGRPFLGFETRRSDLRWLIIQAENSNRRLQADLAALKAWAGDDWPKLNQQLFIHTLEYDCDYLLSLDNLDAQNRISDTISQIDPGVVCFDSLYNFGIGDLNRDEDMSATLLTLARLGKTGNSNRATVMLHHALTGRTGAARATGYDRASFGRNSKVLHSWTRGQINVAPGSADSNDTLVFSCGKCSNGKEFAPFASRLNPSTMIYEVDQDFDMEAWQDDVTGSHTHAPTITPERVAELCKGAMEKRQLVRSIMEDSGCARSYAYRMVEATEKAHLIHYSKASEKYIAKS